MIKKIIAMLLTPAFCLPAYSQVGALPIKEWPSLAQTPFILYLSGDGGLNNFTNGLCTSINKSGYGITALNSKSYFWNKKTPDQTTAAIADYLEKKFRNRANRQLVLVGYSFGADVMPFIVNRLPKDIISMLMAVVLISPSTSTDFEIHWSDMFGGTTRRSMDVLAEINKMKVPRTSTYFGAEEGDFPVTGIQLKNYHNQTLPGGHRFDGHTNELAEAIIEEFK